MFFSFQITLSWTHKLHIPKLKLELYLNRLLHMFLIRLRFAIKWRIHPLKLKEYLQARPILNQPSDARPKHDHFSTTKSGFCFDSHRYVFLVPKKCFLEVLTKCFPCRKISFLSIHFFVLYETMSCCKRKILRQEKSYCCKKINLAARNKFFIQ